MEQFLVITCFFFNYVHRVTNFAGFFALLLTFDRVYGVVMAQFMDLTILSWRS